MFLADLNIVKSTRDGMTHMFEVFKNLYFLHKILFTSSSVSNTLDVPLAPLRGIRPPGAHVDGVVNLPEGTLGDQCDYQIDGRIGRRSATRCIGYGRLAVNVHSSQDRNFGYEVLRKCACLLVDCCSRG